MFLHIIDLSKPNLVFAVLAGITQYFQTKMLLPNTGPKQKNESDFSQVMQKQMTYFLPAFTVIILIGLPSALGLYWTISGIFSIIQQYFILKNKPEKVKS
jgi:YidC/Oxa1 family membrane protein insertase